MSMKANQTALSLLLPKTGQITSYQSGDDGDYEAGWWRGLLNANNKTRFIAKTFDGDGVVIDLATGLMWAADGNLAGCGMGATYNWVNSIIYAQGLSFAGFNDWRLPNINELNSIIDWGKDSPAVDTAFFPNTQEDYYWSSTTMKGLTTRGWLIYFGDGGMLPLDKGQSWSLRCVRGGL